MKNIYFMCRLYVFIFLVGFGQMGQGQTLYALKIDRNIRFEAADITAKYQPRLVMGSDQALSFKLKVAQFLVKRKAVKEDPTLSPKGKYDLLKRISSRETSEMADILESYQWQEYMRIKNSIQPVPQPHNLRQNLIAHEEEP